MSEFNGLGLHLGNLPLLSRAKTRSISAENFTGEKGKGGMATEGTGAGAAPRARPGLEGVALRSRSRPAVHVYAGRDRGARRHPAHLDDRATATTGDRWSCASIGTARRRPSVEAPLRRLLLQRLERALPWSARCRSPCNPERRHELATGRCRSASRRGSRSKTSPDEAVVLYYQIDYTLTDVPEDAAYFHAQWRRSNPLPYKEVHTLLDGVKGHGHYVGHLHRLGRQQQRLVGRGRDQVLHRRRRGVPDDLRHRHRRLLRRGLELRASRGRVRRLLDAVPRAVPGDQAGRPVPQPAALRHVPLARDGPDPL